MFLKDVEKQKDHLSVLLFFLIYFHLFVSFEVPQSIITLFTTN